MGAGKGEIAARRGHAAHVDVVLHRDRNAVQRTSPSTVSPLPIQRTRDFDRTGINREDRPELRTLLVVRLDPIQIESNETFVRQPACIDSVLDVGDTGRKEVESTPLGAWQDGGNTQKRTPVGPPT